MNLQAMMDGMSAQWQRERAETQMTLGKMIEKLETLPPDLMMFGLGHLHSYRGYYSDLSFAPLPDKVAVSNVLAECRAAMGQVFTGYKGGIFVMGALTPMWLASYGSTGLRIMALHDDGSLALASDDE